MQNLSKSPNSVCALATQPSFTAQLAAILPRQKGIPAGVAALAASLMRGKELTR